MNNKVILKKPYEREGSFLFFQAIEKGNIELVKLCLQKCRYYLFDLDFVILYL